MELKKIDQTFIHKIKTSSLNWKRVDDMICISAYDKGRFFYSLCKYSTPEGYRMTLTVDDIVRNESDIVKIDLAKGDSGYDDLLSVYNREVDQSTKIDLGRTEYA